jgi:hypothetical protein
MRFSIRLLLALSPVLAAACGVHTDKATAKAAVDTSTESQRKKGFEATAQLLDERPELVDELYGVMRLHPRALDRFLAFASTDLDQKWMAKNMAGYLAKNPAGVEEMLDASIPAVEKEPKARAAMNRSLAKHSDQTADILSDDPHALGRIIASLLAMTQKKPSARKNMLVAMHEDREAIVAFVKEDKPLARAIAVEVVREAVADKPTLEKVLAETGLLDTPPGAPTPEPAKSADKKAKGKKRESEAPLAPAPAQPPAKPPAGGGPLPPPVFGK